MLVDMSVVDCLKTASRRACVHCVDIGNSFSKRLMLSVSYIS